MQAVAYPQAMPDVSYATRLGLVLREARYYREASREDAARACDVSAGTMARWERGDVTAPAEALVRLRDFYSLPNDLLLDPSSSRQEIVARIVAYDDEVMRAQAIARAREEVDRFEPDETSRPSRRHDDHVNGAR